MGKAQDTMDEMDAAEFERKRAEAAEARVAELEGDVAFYKRLAIDYQRQRDEARDRAADLADKLAESDSKRADYRAKLALADRLAEAARNLKTVALESPDPGIDGTWVRHEDLLEVLAAYEAGEVK